MQKRVLKLYPKIWFRGGFDILVTHSPAYQLNDGRDLLHGHVHMSYGRKHKRYDKYEETNVINAFDRCVFEFEAEEPEKQFE